MERRPEPELMESPEQVAAYAAADFAQVNQAFVDRFVRLFPDIRAGTVLDLGCGPADIPIRLCRALPGLRVVAVDGSEAMLAAAREAVDAAGFSERIELTRSLLPELREVSGPFDAVLSNSLLHHLTDPIAFWKKAASLVRPGGALYVVDLARPASSEAAKAIVNAAGASESEILREDFFRSLLAAYTVDEITEQLERAELRDMGVAVVSDRHLAAWGRVARGV